MFCFVVCLLLSFCGCLLIFKVLFQCQHSGIDKDDTHIDFLKGNLYKNDAFMIDFVRFFCFERNRPTFAWRPLGAT